jgi:hypothetical protein
MNDERALVFDDASKLGKVVAVDTSRVLIAVENATLLPRAAVGSLCAIQGAIAQEFLIGMSTDSKKQFHFGLATGSLRFAMGLRIPSSHRLFEVREELTFEL